MHDWIVLFSDGSVFDAFLCVFGSRAIKALLDYRPHCAFPRTLLDLSKKNWAHTMDEAFLATFGHKLNPPFDPYRNSLNYLISTYTIPYVGLTGYVGSNPLLTGYNSKRVRSCIQPPFWTSAAFERISSRLSFHSFTIWVKREWEPSQIKWDSCLEVLAFPSVMFPSTVLWVLY